MPMKASVDVDDTIRDMRKLGLNVSKLMPKLIARLSLKGEAFIKPIMPWRTGTLRRSTHAHPTTKPNTIAVGVSYAFIANVRSKRPGFIEATVEHIEKVLVPQEAEIVIKQALKKV